MRHLPSALRRPLLLGLIPAALVLTACGGSSSGGAASPSTSAPVDLDPSASAGASSAASRPRRSTIGDGPAPTVTGAFDTKPDGGLPSDKPSDNAGHQDRHQGDRRPGEEGRPSRRRLPGPDLGHDRQGLRQLLHPRSARVVPDRHSARSSPAGTTRLVGVNAGSRVVLVVPPAAGYGAAGQTDAGIKGTDTLVFVVDVIKSYDGTARGNGSKTSASLTGLPTVTGAVDAGPTVKVASRQHAADEADRGRPRQGHRRAAQGGHTRHRAVRRGRLGQHPGGEQLDRQAAERPEHRRRRQRDGVRRARRVSRWAAVCCSLIPAPTGQDAQDQEHRRGHRHRRVPRPQWERSSHGRPEREARDRLPGGPAPHGARHHRHRRRRRQRGRCPAARCSCTTSAWTTRPASSSTRPGTAARRSASRSTASSRAGRKASRGCASAAAGSWSCPPEKAYGPAGSGHRLSGQTLIFVIDLLDA